ncbi:ALG-2 interacting protein X [Arachis hypogaea]|nr:ALG-2 interacting protein X [Arachis hypogaea]
MISLGALYVTVRIHASVAVNIGGNNINLMLKVPLLTPDLAEAFISLLQELKNPTLNPERSVRENSAFMSILDARPIESALPTLARPIMSLDQNEDAIVGSLKQSLRQVETLGAQRAGLEDMLKEMKRKAQNDEFSALFNLEDYKASRENAISRLKLP